MFEMSQVFLSKRIFIFVGKGSTLARYVLPEITDIWKLSGFRRSQQFVMRESRPGNLPPAQLDTGFRSASSPPLPSGSYSEEHFQICVCRSKLWCTLGKKTRIKIVSSTYSRRTSECPNFVCTTRDFHSISRPVVAV